MKIILVYKKYGALRYLGHLDFQHLLERLIRISALPIDYTEGFHPLMKMNILQPLSVGMEGQNEFLHLSLKEEVALNHIKEKLDSIVPDGLTLLKVSKTSWTAKQFHRHKRSALVECTLRYPCSFRNDLLTLPVLSIKTLTSTRWLIEIVNTSQEQTNISKLLLTRTPNIDILALKRVRLNYS